MTQTASLASCFQNFLEGTSLNGPIPGHNIAPFVEVRFTDNQGNQIGDHVITVGNLSDRNNNNHAVIKSLDYGTLSGAVCKVVIADEEGGAFDFFARRLAKNLEEATLVEMRVKFGWIGTSCGSNSGRIVHPRGASSTPELRFMPLQMDIDYTGGLTKFTITGTDIFQAVFTSRVEKAYGEGKTLAESIVEMMADGSNPTAATGTESNPPAINVNFVDFEGSNVTDIKNFFRNDSPKPARKCHGQNKLGCAQEWIRGQCTRNDRGALFKYDACAKTLLVLEDPMPTCDQAGNVSIGNNNPLGSFIVNGGPLSNVISFTPQLNWIAPGSNLSRPAATGSGNTARTFQKGNRCAGETDVEQGLSNNPKGGNKTGAIEDLAATNEDNTAPSDPDETGECQSRAAKADSLNQPGLRPIEAELKIQGDPRSQFTCIRQIVGKRIAIAVVNPLHLGASSGGCPEWQFLAGSPCNEFLSNKNWFIMGVQHSIQEGSYTTTFKLFLPAPTIDLPQNESLGGDDDAPAVTPEPTATR